MGTLVFLRHGQSQWNLENRFTGWSDVPLTDRGQADARVTAGVLKDFSFDLGFTSRLQRAHRTMDIILGEIGRADLPVTVDSALNERHYGDLQGLNKAETAEKYGQELVKTWRRSYSTRPPNGESLEDCYRRVVPFLKAYILPHAHAGKTVFVVASANSLKPVIQYFDGLSNEAIAEYEVPLCTPYVYRFDGEKIVSKEVCEVPGIVTLGASTTQKSITDGRV